MLCGAACVDVLTDNTNCGACGRVCGTSSRCVSGTCLEGDAGTVQDAGGMDAVVTPADVPATGTDALLGGDVVCRTPEQPILRRCNSDNDCESCAPFTSGLPWCCRGTGYCENTSALWPSATTSSRVSMSRSTFDERVASCPGTRPRWQAA